MLISRNLGAKREKLEVGRSPSENYMIHTMYISLPRQYHEAHACTYVDVGTYTECTCV